MYINNNYSTIGARERTVIGGGSGCPRTSGCFRSILQEQISKSMGSESSESTESSVKASPVVNFRLTGRVVEWSEIEARGRYDRFANDPELEAYGRQLAAENGIAPRNGADPGRMKEGQEEFLYLLSQLIDKGLITRQDIIESVEYAPTTYKRGDGSVDYHINMNGFGKRMTGIELTNDLDLFEMLWGAERLADVMSKTSKVDGKKKDDDNEDLFTKIWGPNGMIDAARERFAAMRKDKQDIPEKQVLDVTASEPENEKSADADYAGLSEAFGVTLNSSTAPARS